MRAVVVLLVIAVGCDSAAERAYLEGLRAMKGESPADPIAQFTRAIELDPRRARYYEVRASALESRGELRAALADFDQAVALEPRAYLYFERGYCHAERGDAGAARQDFQRAIAAQPENGQFYVGDALAELLLDRAGDALATIDRAIALAPRDSSARYLRAVILARSGRAAEAAVAFAAIPAVTCAGNGRTVPFDGEHELQKSRTRPAAQIWRAARGYDPDDFYRDACR
jgi:tetratricopeptide (TPR) repeat protein